MARIDVIAYSPTDIVEESNVTLSRCIELIGKFPTTWINIVNLDKGSSDLLEHLFGFHHLALEDCVNTDQRPKVEDYEGILFLVTRTIRWEVEIETDQLSMFLSKRYVLTVHDKDLPQLEEVRVRIRKKLPKILKGGPDYLCFCILDTIVDSYFPEIDRLGDVIDGLEGEVLEDPSKKTVDTIHQLRRDLLHLRKELNPQREALAYLARGDLPHFRKETRNYLRDVHDHMIRVLDSMDAYRELTADILANYFGAMQVSLNEVMKLLTIIATIMLPLTFIASIYGMNLPIPEAGHQFAYPGILLSMLIISALMLLYFRRRKWI